MRGLSSTFRVGQIKAVLWASLAMALLLGLLAGTGTAQAQQGNPGTVKIHDAITDEEDRRNEPHVCEFYIAGMGFHPLQLGQGWVIEGHPPTAGAGRLHGYWNAEADGSWRTLDINAGLTDPHTDLQLMLPNGHYRLTVHTGRGAGKHKMFWVDCPEVPDNGTGNGTGNGNGNGVPPITGLPPTGGAAPQSQGGTGWALGLLAAVFSGIVAAGLRVTKGISRL